MSKSSNQILSSLLPFNLTQKKTDAPLERSSLPSFWQPMFNSTLLPAIFRSLISGGSFGGIISDGECWEIFVLDSDGRLFGMETIITKNSAEKQRHVLGIGSARLMIIIRDFGDFGSRMLPEFL